MHVNNTNLYTKLGLWFVSLSLEIFEISKQSSTQSYELASEIKCLSTLLTTHKSKIYWLKYD